jgi:hypothetical protein
MVRTGAVVLVVVALIALIAPGVACWAAPGASKPTSGRIAMECRAEIMQREPLTVHFSLVLPHDAPRPMWVPRVLLPLGAFVAAELRDGGGTVVWNTERPKFHPKLDPAAPAAYVEIDPGYSHGVVLVLEGVRPGSAEHSLTLSYGNLQYRGFAGHELGDQSCMVTVRIPAI